jgi:hypothetical protein
MTIAASELTKAYLERESEVDHDRIGLINLINLFGFESGRAAESGETMDALLKVKSNGNKKEANIDESAMNESRSTVVGEREVVDFRTAEQEEQQQKPPKKSRVNAWEVEQEHTHSHTHAQIVDEEEV